MPTVNLFITCLLDTLFPDVAQAVVDVLEAQNVRVRIPFGQTCCGQPAFNAGHWSDARTMARHTLDVFGDSDEPVLVPSGSCASMIAHYYPELFKDDPENASRARSLAGRVVEFTQYVVDHLGITDVGASYEAKAVYHPSCHTLRGMEVDRQPRALLSDVKGLQILEQENPETCCGFGGVFAVKMGDISGAMLNATTFVSLLVTGLLIGHMVLGGAGRTALNHALYTVLPNMQTFWIAEGLMGEEKHIDWRYVWLAFRYAVCFNVAMLALAACLFEERELLA